MKRVNAQRLARAIVLGVVAFAQNATAADLPPLPAQVPVVDLPAGVLKPQRDITSWIANDRHDLMKAHAWELFEALMLPLYDNGGETVRFFETWYSLDEIVPAIGAPLVGATSGKPLLRPREQLRHLEAAGQTAHGARTEIQDGRTLSETVVSDVKYNSAIAHFVESDLTLKGKNASGHEIVTGYTLKSKVVPGGTGTVLFNDKTGVMLKPAFTIVKAKGPTVIGRWDEDQNVTNPFSVSSYQLPKNADPRVATPRLWKKEALIYPAVTSEWSEPVTYYGRDGTPIAVPADVKALPKFNLSDFHYIKLTKAHVESLKSGGLGELMGSNIDNIEVGDYALLTAMHIATREIDTWTWQTFWWQPLGGETLAANGASLRQQLSWSVWPSMRPLKHFRAGVGYSYTSRTGDPIIASNPYIEGGFGLPAALDAVFGVTRATEGVNVFLRNPDGTALSYAGTNYVHGFEAKPGSAAIGLRGATYSLRTNCVTCHTAAAYPAQSIGALPPATLGAYPDYGLLKGTEALFTGRVRTHFLWGVANKISAREAAAGTP